MNIEVVVADESHAVYADEICEEVFISARERGTGIARRTPEYVIEKMVAGKAVIAIAEERLNARNNKDWAKSDELRDKLTALGYQVKDGKGEYTITKI